jgi:hypothetical protein
MVSTLQELCYQKLASTMNGAPPILQEMIMGETKEYFKKEIRSEVKAEVREEQKELAYNDIMETVPLLVPEIMSDILASMTQNGRMRQDFRIIYAHLSPQAVSCAIETAEHAVRNLDDRYIHNSFGNVSQVNYESDEYSLLSSSHNDYSDDLMDRDEDEDRDDEDEDD